MKRAAENRATHSKRYLRRGPYLAEVQQDGNVYRFMIRDETRLKPTIHGTKKSLHETESEVEAVLDRLCPIEQAA